VKHLIVRMEITESPVLVRRARTTSVLSLILRLSRLRLLLSLLFSTIAFYCAYLLASPPSNVLCLTSFWSMLVVIILLVG
jgi:hypothetical protein